MSSTDLAAVLIVRDEARCLARCLTSLQPWVDEIVVLDTGSIDATVAIARDHGARVSFFEWCDDFSAARNAALSLAGADFSLVIDADEWIDEGGENLRRHASHTSAASGAAGEAGPIVGLAHVRSSLEVDGRMVDSVVVSERLLPAGVRYAGRVHEQPVHAFRAAPVCVTIGHDGYAPEPAARKRGRNEQLVRRELADRPEDPYLRYQLGKELAASGRLADAADEFLLARRLAPASAPYRHALAIAGLSTLTRAGRLQEGLQVVEEELPSWPDSPDLHFMMGNLFLELSLVDPASAETLMPMIEASWLRSLEIGDRPGLAGSVEGRGSYFAAHNLSVFYESLGVGDEARRYGLLAGRATSA